MRARIRPDHLPALTILLPLAATAFAEVAFAQETLEDFEVGTNVAGWSISGFTDLEATGGNPGFWLHADSLDTFGPILANDPNVASDFMGDFRAEEVTRISVDARTDSMDFPACGFPFALVLRDTQGTANPDDDDYAYFWDPESIDGMGKLFAPCIGEGWVHYDFPIPSQATVPVPMGWFGGWSGDPENFRPGIDWNDVIASVDTVEIWWGAPPVVAIFQNWDVGIDNVAIERGTSLIFADGFESGDTAGWSATVP